MSLKTLAHTVSDRDSTGTWHGTYSHKPSHRHEAPEYSIETVFPSLEMKQ